MTEQVGSVADEASRLFAAAEAWWHGVRSAGDASPDGAAEAHTGPECRICPLCQLLSLLRTSRPEVFEHLSSAALSIVQAARAAVDAHARTATSRPTSSVERIDIR